jgi:outer membrane protein assembly factor BamD (BamD/ComL family)
MEDITIMIQNAIQDKISPTETIEEVNKIIRDEIKKAFETVNIPAATMPPTKPEKNAILQDNDVYNDLTKGLVEDVIRALKNNNIEEAITRLTLADQQIIATPGNQTSKLFIERAIRSIKNNNTKEAITTLKLAYGM